jgi:hypothetical protein
MTTKGKEPGNPDSAPFESRRTPAAADVGANAPEEPIGEDGESAPIDMPAMGEFSAESARQTPLDDLAETERARLPAD